jgi:hypothetical protein
MIRTLNKGKKKLDWYVKWSASIMVLIAIIARASGPEFRDVDMIFGTIGICLWLWVSLLWEDRALILLNGVSFFILVTGLVKEFGPIMSKLNLLSYAF